MMMTGTYTPQCLTALMWFAAREPVGWFDKTAPSHSMRSALERRGLIERIPDRRPVHLTKFRVTDRGHETLKGAQR